GGFRYTSAATKEQSVLAQKQQLLVRYYLWAADGPWRLPNQLHQDLMDREVALPQFAGTKQTPGAVCSVVRAVLLGSRALASTDIACPHVLLGAALSAFFFVTRFSNSTQTSSITVDHSPLLNCLNNLAVGYHGESLRSNNHRQSGLNDNSTQIGL